VKHLLVAALVLACAAHAEAAPTCAEAGAGAMRGSVARKLHVRYSDVLGIAGAKVCRVDRWSARARACFARLSVESTDRKFRRCLKRLTVAQKIGFRDALRDEMNRIDQQLEERQLRDAH
jgi:hypothetical protein